MLREKNEQLEKMNWLIQTLLKLSRIHPSEIQAQAPAAQC